MPSKEHTQSSQRLSHEETVKQPEDRTPLDVSDARLADMSSCQALTGSTVSRRAYSEEIGRSEWVGW